VWDLCRGEEVQSLEGHPNNVVCVKYSEPQRIVYTVSSAFIKVVIRLGRTKSYGNLCYLTFSFWKGKTCFFLVSSTVKHPRNVLAAGKKIFVSLNFLIFMTRIKKFSSLLKIFLEMIIFQVWDLRMKPSACIKTLSSSGNFFLLVSLYNYCLFTMEIVIISDVVLFLNNNF